MIFECQQLIEELLKPVPFGKAAIEPQMPREPSAEDEHLPCASQLLGCDEPDGISFRLQGGRTREILPETPLVSKAAVRLDHDTLVAPHDIAIHMRAPDKGAPLLPEFDTCVELWFDDPESSHRRRGREGEREPCLERGTCALHCQPSCFEQTERMGSEAHLPGELPQP